MIELRMMAGGLAALGAAFNREIRPEVAEVYHQVLGPRLDADDWARAVKRCLENETFFPPPAVLLRYGLREGVPEARAVEDYQAILGSFEDGQPMGPREIRERFGEAAMEAFVAAGGTRAFSWCEPRDEPFRRKAFVEAWTEVEDQDPALALPAGDSGHITEGSNVDLVGDDFPQARAVEVFRELQQRSRTS
jgi:hypothetical protein